MKLPVSDWHQGAALRALLTALDSKQGATRFVGGAVRDTVLDLPVKDVDLATRLRPDDVMARLKQAGLKVIPTGIDHGTVTAVTADGPVEITTLRKDVSTDGRRATVTFTDDWKEDAARRDFTINALSVDPETLEIFDYFNGLSDLKTRNIRFIGSARDRIAEDHLRIMRYFRFLARFGQDAVEETGFAACKAGAASLKSLSRERVSDELMKLLVTDDPRFAVSKMLEAEIFSHIFAETDVSAVSLLSQLIERERLHDISPSAIRRLTTLLPKDADKAAKIVTGLKFSKKMRRAVVARLTELSSSVIPAKADIQSIKDERVSAITIPALAYHHGADAARDIALLFAPDEELANSLTKLDGWEKPIFPLKGGDLIAMGLKPGPIVAETLVKVQQAWIEEGFTDGERVRALAQKLVLRT